MARVGEKIYACRVLIRKFEGKRSLGRSRLRREDNVMKWTLKKEECVDWLKLIQEGLLVDCCEGNNEHWRSITACNFVTS